MRTIWETQIYAWNGAHGAPYESVIWMMHRSRLKKRSYRIILIPQERTNSAKSTSSGLLVDCNAGFP